MAAMRSDRREPMGPSWSRPRPPPEVPHGSRPGPRGQRVRFPANRQAATLKVPMTATPDHDPRRPAARRRPLRLRPSKVRPEAVAALAAEALPPTWAPATARRTVKFMVSRLRNAVPSCSRCPTATRCSSATAAPPVLGRRHLRSDRRAQPAPHLRRVLVQVRRVPPPGAAPRRSEGDRATPAPHPVLGGRGRHRPVRPHPQRDLDGRGHARCAAEGIDDGALVAVDATSAAGGLRFDAAADRRLLLRPPEVPRLRRWALDRRGVARCGRAHRAHRASSDRWIPASLDLKIALDNSRKDQTYNTPALATIFLAVQPDGVDQPERWPRLLQRPMRPLGGDHVQLGRGLRATPRRS
jgi:hypothetical protein